MCMLQFVVTFSSPIGKKNVTTKMSQLFLHCHVIFRKNIMCMLQFVATFSSPIGKKNVTTKMSQQFL